MLTPNQENFLEKIPAGRSAKIEPFDPKVLEVAGEIIEQIKKTMPETEVFFGGASALKIAGQNDIDLNILSTPAEYPRHLPKLIELFGEPATQSSNLIKWEFTKDEFDVEAYLTDKNSPALKEQMKTFKILRDFAELRQEYEKLKLACDGLPFKEYMRRKYEFFNKILAEKT